MPDGGDPLLQRVADRWSENGVGTNAGVTVTHAASASLTHIVTGIQVSGDLAALITIESPASTVLWRSRQTASFDRTFTFPPGVLQGAPGAALLVKVSASTANCEANIQGLSVLSGVITDLATEARF